MLCIFRRSNAIRAVTEFLCGGDIDCQLVRVFFAVVHNIFRYQTCQVAVLVDDRVRNRHDRSVDHFFDVFV